MSHTTIATDGMYRLTKNGVLKRSTHLVQLRIEDKHFYNHRGERVITAQGFAHMNRLAGVSFISPASLLDDHGKEIGNPEIRRTNGNIRFVRVRRLGIGRDFNGTLRAIDLTVSYDIESYFYGDLFAKFQGSKNTNWARLVNDQAVERLLTEKETSAAAYVMPGIALVYDVTSQEARDKLNENRMRVLYGDRLAVSICERNILKRHFGITHVPQDGAVKVTAWGTTDIDWEKLNRNLHARSGAIQLDGETVKIEVEKTNTTEEDILAADPTDADLTDCETKPDQAEREKLLASLRHVIRAHERDQVLEVAKQFGVTDLKQLPKCEAEILVKIQDAIRSLA